MEQCFVDDNLFVYLQISIVNVSLQKKKKRVKKEKWIINFCQREFKTKYDMWKQNIESQR